MDDRRFDDLTKLVGRRASRRTIIKAALAGAVASVFGSSIAEAALSPIKTRPRLCIQPGQPCAAPGADPSRDCCYKCNSTTHKCCENIGYLCTKDTDCCKTASGVQPICRDPQAAGTDRRKACFLPGTLNPGAQCTQNGDCASGNCINGVCSACAVGTTVCGATCCTTAQCQVCVGGVCKSKCGPCQRCENGACVPICDRCQKCVNNQCVPKCSAALCQTCDPATGVCSTCNGNKCQKCVNGQCVAKCNLCQTCDPATGVCTPNTCPNLCDACNPANGQCAPKTCGPCETCNPTTGVCQSTCAACQRCQNNVCVDTCPTSTCQQCNAGTGLCESACELCETCDSGGAGCIPIDCSAFGFGCLGKACDPATGECTVDDPLSGIPCVDLNGCTLNDTCFDGVCIGEPVNCGPCGVCVSDSPTNFHCEDACLECEECDPYGAGCVPVDCSAVGDGICSSGECQAGQCIAIPINPEGPCPDPLTGPGNCCDFECCDLGICDCTDVDGQGTLQCILGDIPDNCGFGCPPGTFCEEAVRVCTRLRCDTDPCPTGSVCYAGLCQPLCNHCLTTGCDGCDACNEETGECEPTVCDVCETCNEQTGQCESPDCPPGWVVEVGFCSCAFPCGSDADCADPCGCFVTGDGNLCLNAIPFADCAVCPPGSICFSSGCIQFCGPASG